MRNATCAALAAILCLAAAPALADAIDGDWCSTAARRHLSIDGPKIVTPGGRTLQGEYSRHGFVYTAPAGETEAGRRVDLRLVNDRTMTFRAEGGGGDEIWNRCARPTS
jgi:hypothetical protein